jgi:hypothetical protein
MAAFQLTANIPSIQPNVGGSNTAACTVLAFKAATNQRVKLLGYGFYLNGTLNSAQPVQVLIGRITTFTGSYTAVTLNPEEPEISLTPQTTAYLNNAGTTEPTYTALKTITIHPQLGYEYLAPLGQEDIIGGAGYWGFQVTEPAAVNVRGYAKIEEG